MTAHNPPLSATASICTWRSDVLDDTGRLSLFRPNKLSTLPSKFKNLEHVPETFPVKFSKKLVTLLNVPLVYGNQIT